MPTFQCGGQEWLLSLDAPKVLAVRQECGQNLAFGSGEPFDILGITSDPVVLPHVLWVLCRSQAEARKIDRDVFESMVVGDVTEDAGIALAEAIVNFIPSRTRREALREWVTQERKAKEAATKLAMERLREVGTELDAALLEVVNQSIDGQLTLLKSVTASPESPESPPAG